MNGTGQRALPARLYLADPGAPRRRAAAALRDFALALDRHLDRGWTLVEGASWPEGGPASVPQEFDLLALHPDHGLIVVEIKAAPVSFDPRHGWLFGGTPWERSPRNGSLTPPDQVDRARRNLLTGLRLLSLAPDRYLTIGRGIAILEGDPWWPDGKAPAPGLMAHEVLVGRAAEASAWLATFADRLRERRRKSADPGGLTSGELAVLLDSFGFAAGAATSGRNASRRKRAQPPSDAKPVTFADALQLWLPRRESPVILLSQQPLLPPRTTDERIAGALLAAAGIDDEARRRIMLTVRQRIEAMADPGLLVAIAATHAALAAAELGGAAYAALSDGLDALSEAARSRGLKTGLPGGPRRSPATLALASLKLALEEVFVSPALAAERIRAAVLTDAADAVIGRVIDEPERFGRVRRRSAPIAKRPDLHEATRAAIRSLAEASGA